MITLLIIDGIVLVIALILLFAERALVTYGECSITINGEKDLKVLGGDNLLAYLNQEKIFIPSACGGKATCGFCKMKILSGAGKILPTEETFMTREEREQGIRLACQVKVKRALDIFIPEYLLQAEEFQSEVSFIDDITHDIKLIRLKIMNNKTISFKPGQYIQFRIPGTDEYRAYSIASAPVSKGQIELIIRLVPGGLCSTYVHRVLEKGDEVIFTGAFGDFCLREESTKDIIAIGGGCGMAPIRSMLHHLARQRMPRRFTYFFGARARQDLFFSEELHDLENKFTNFKYVPALSEPKHTDKWEGEIGLITQVAEKYLTKDGEKEAYLCGPPPMIDAAMIVLAKNGVSSQDTFYDQF